MSGAPELGLLRLAHGAGLPAPAYATEGSAGLDLHAAVEDETRLAPGERALIPTGLSLTLPAGHEGQIRPRSGLALKHGLTVLNSPGTIDEDYRGEIGVLLINLGGESVTVRRGERIAQLVIAPVTRVQVTARESLEESARGAGGFGSTGRGAETGTAVIHTDGACSGNPGPGGWGALVAMGEHERRLKGGEAATTNNRMEMMAAIRALEALKRPCRVQLHTDSVYLRNGITQWIHGWKRNGWRTADKKPVKNVDLWERLDTLAAEHEIEWHWVKGHAGDPGNEAADELAREGMAPYL